MFASAPGFLDQRSLLRMGEPALCREVLFEADILTNFCIFGFLPNLTSCGAHTQLYDERSETQLNEATLAFFPYLVNSVRHVT